MAPAIRKPAEDAISTVSSSSVDETSTDSELGKETTIISKKTIDAERCMAADQCKPPSTHRATKINKMQQRALLAMQQELRFAAVWAEQVLSEATARDAELQKARSLIEELQAAQKDTNASEAKVAALQAELTDCQSQLAKERAVNSSSRATSRTQQAAQAAELRDLKEQLSSARKELQDCKTFSENQQRSLKKELQAVTDESRAQSEQLKSVRKELYSSKSNSEAQIRSLKKELQAVTAELEECRATSCGDSSKSCQEVRGTPDRQPQKIALVNESPLAPSNAAPSNAVRTKSASTNQQSDAPAPAPKGRRVGGRPQVDVKPAAQRMAELRRARTSGGNLPWLLAVAVAIQAMVLVIWYAS